MSLLRPSLVSLVVALATRSAHAQTPEPPRACTHTAPSEIATTATAPVVSAVMTEQGGSKLWVLYGDRTAGHDVVTLLELSGLDGHELRVDTHPVGEGHVLPRGLARVGDRVVAAYLPATGGGVGVFVHPVAGGTDTTTVLASPRPATALAVGALRRRVLVAWSDGTEQVFHASIDLAAPSRARVRTARAASVASLAISARLGGILLADPRQTPSTLGWIRAGASRIAPTPGPRAVGPIDALAAGEIGTRAAVLVEGGGQVRLVVLAPPGRGLPRTVRTLGTIATTAEAALGAAGFGALAAWIEPGAVRVVPIGIDATPGGEAFAVAEGATAQRASSLVVTGPTSAGTDRAMVLWGGTNAQGRGVVRMVRVICH